jgi:glycosyltransferase involved in cell wall biosynthesis
VTPNKPRVSIGLPVFNGELYLEETLDSILNQTFSDFELIISDNASTDSTQQICERYAVKDGRIKYYRNIRNLGVAPNYNRVFELSSGEYFKWADHDDPLAPDFISKCVDVLDNRPEVVVCFPKAKLIDENGNLIHDYDPLPDTSSPQPHIRFGKLILAHDHRLAQASGLMRANLVKKTVMHASYPCSDEVFLAHLGLLGHYHEIPERLFYLRSHPNQSSKGVLASERARVLFFDTSLKGKLVLIKWLYFRGCLHAINSSPISIYQRICCYFLCVTLGTETPEFPVNSKRYASGNSQADTFVPATLSGSADTANKTHHYQ